MEPEIREGPRLGDAFGAGIMACLEGGEQPGASWETIERDDGLLEGHDSIPYFFPFDQWDPLDRWLAERVTGRVLDVGAGAGRAALHFQEQGHDVTTLDISPLACEVCRRRGVRDVFEGTVSDLRDAPEGRTFDTVLLLGANLGLLESRHHAPVFLDALAAITSSDARILGRGVDPYDTDNPLHLAYHKRNRALGRMGGQVRIRVRFRDLATPYFDYLFTSIAELQSLLASTVWELEDCRRDGPTYGAVLRKRLADDLGADAAAALFRSRGGRPAPMGTSPAS